MSRLEIEKLELINDAMTASAIAFVVAYSDFSHLILKRKSELLLRSAKSLTSSLVNDEGVNLGHEIVLDRYRKIYRTLLRASKDTSYDEVTQRCLQSLLLDVRALAKDIKTIKVDRRVPTLDQDSNGRPMTIARMQDFVFSAYCSECGREMASMHMPKLQDVIGADIIWGGGNLIVKCKRGPKHQTSVIGNYTRNAKHHDTRIVDVEFGIL